MKKNTKLSIIILFFAIVILVMIYSIISSCYISTKIDKEKISFLEFWWPYILVFIVILILVIEYERINHKEIINKKEEIFNKVKEKLTINFKEDNFIDEEAKQIAIEDCEALASYDSLVESEANEYDEYCIDCNDIFKMSYQEKEIDFFSYEDGYYNVTNNRVYYYFILGILKEVNNEKRLHIAVKDKWNIKSNSESFEDIFKDYKDVVNEYDKKFGKKCAIALNRKYNGKKFKNSGNNIYMELTEYQKQALLELYKQTKLKFSLILENGIIRILVGIPEIEIKSKGNQEKIEDIIEKISKIFIELIEEY